MICGVAGPPGRGAFRPGALAAFFGGCHAAIVRRLSRLEVLPEEVGVLPPGVLCHGSRRAGGMSGT